MTETRKAIIELIEPYMDKTLSVGCIIFNHWVYYTISALLESINIIQYMWWWHDMLDDFKEWVDNKIIWQYEMTAVLKYIFIEWVSKYKLRDPMFDNANIHCERLWLYWNPQFIIPNKPLHLYTKEEDKNILDLLLKIK